VPCYAYQPTEAEDQDLEGFCGEEFVSGEFVKLTSNAGFVNREEYGGHAVYGSAFSHYTFHWSHGALLVSDIQG
ncbi:EEF2K, partial [Symbiodinium pilosum]